MEPLITMNNITFSSNPILTCLFDKENHKLAFLSKEYDEIHLIVEVVNNKLVFHPRFNVNITTEKPNEFYIDVNYPTTRLP